MQLKLNEPEIDLLVQCIENYQEMLETNTDCDAFEEELALISDILPKLQSADSDFVPDELALMMCCVRENCDPYLALQKRLSQYMEKE